MRPVRPSSLANRPTHRFKSDASLHQAHTRTSTRNLGKGAENHRAATHGDFEGVCSPLVCAQKPTMSWLPQDIPAFAWCGNARTRFCRCRIRCCSEILQVVFLEAQEPSYPPPPIDSAALGSAEFHHNANHLNVISPSSVSVIPLLIPIVDLARRRDFQAAIDRQMRSGNVNDSSITPTANGGGHADLRQMDVDPNLRCCHRMSRREVGLRWMPARKVCVL